jgi:RNase adapter protein RapZ
LREAIASERGCSSRSSRRADLVIDTSNMGVHALRELIRERIDRRLEGRLSLMFESFGYKHGIPGDADFVFDVRSLPNPYWEHSLRD